MALAPGIKLGIYEIRSPLGAGGMGEVYRARDPRLNRDVAIKVLPPGRINDESTRKRFRKEALALAKLNHPNIETVHQFLSENGADYLVIGRPVMEASDPKAAADAIQAEIMQALG